MTIATICAYMVYAGAVSTWQYYVTVEECLQDQTQLQGQRLRVAGTVVEGSLKIAASRKSGCFTLENREQGSTKHQLMVQCECYLPQTLTEGIGVVAEGVLAPDGILRAHEVLTRCASKYSSNTPGGTQP